MQFRLRFSSVGYSQMLCIPEKIHNFFHFPYRAQCYLLPVIGECHHNVIKMYLQFLNWTKYAFRFVNESLFLEGGRSTISKTFNHMFYKCRLERNIFYIEIVRNICKQSIVNRFSTDDEVLYRRVFTQYIVYERENSQLL